MITIYKEDTVMKKYVHASTDETWQSLKDQLEMDCERYLDPFYEGTDAADKVLYDYQQPIEDELGIWLEPSVQAGTGGIWIYSSDDDETLASNVDYQNFNDHCLYLVFSSDSGEEFKEKYKEYLESLIE